MTPETIAAEVLVRGYLDGRSLNPDAFASMIWIAERRIRESRVPALSQAMCMDIDSEAGNASELSRPWAVNTHSSPAALAGRNPTSVENPGLILFRANENFWFRSLDLEVLDLLGTPQSSGPWQAVPRLLSRPYWLLVLGLALPFVSAMGIWYFASGL